MNKNFIFDQQIKDDILANVQNGYHSEIEIRFSEYYNDKRDPRRKGFVPGVNYSTFERLKHFFVTKK